MTARTATDVVARALAGARIRYVDSNGLRHRVVTFNPQAERDVLFIPGITSPAETARFIADALPHLRSACPGSSWPRAHRRVPRMPIPAHRLSRGRRRNHRGAGPE